MRTVGLTQSTIAMVMMVIWNEILEPVYYVYENIALLLNFHLDCFAVMKRYFFFLIYLQSRKPDYKILTALCLLLKEMRKYIF